MRSEICCKDDENINRVWTAGFIPPARGAKEEKRGEVEVAKRTCRVCALSREVEPEGARFCYKYKRIKEADETGWDWGCLYFCEIVPEENLSLYQYLLIKETEILTRK